MRAWTARVGLLGEREKFFGWNAEDFPEADDVIDEFGVGQVIKNVAPAPLRLNKVGITQNHEVLRNDRLPHPQTAFKMADTRFSFPDGEEDFQACGLPNGIEKGRQCRNCNRFKRYIRNHEYNHKGKREKNKREKSSFGGWIVRPYQAHPRQALVSGGWGN